MLKFLKINKLKNGESDNTLGKSLLSVTIRPTSIMFSIAPLKQYPGMAFDFRRGVTAWGVFRRLYFIAMHQRGPQRFVYGSRELYVAGKKEYGTANNKILKRLLA
jgi:hypothetical protein